MVSYNLPKDEKTIRQSIGTMFKVLRKEQLLSRAEMARLIGESEERVKGYENGKIDISAVTLFKVGEVLRYRINTFFDAYYNPQDYPSLESIE